MEIRVELTAKTPPDITACPINGTEKKRELKISAIKVIKKIAA